MRDLHLSGSRRKRLADTETSSSAQGSGPSIVPTAIGLILTVMIAVCLIAPNQVDNALSRTASAVTDKNAVATEAWSSVVSTFAIDDVEGGQITNTSLNSGGTVLKQNESIATGSTGRTVLTSGHDILELEPATAITVGESGLQDSTTIIRLLDGTIGVKAAKRTDGGTLSIETQYLVATVKGTKFYVMTTDDGAAVSVTEGVVSVRSVGSSDGVDVTRGRTAVVSSADGATPRVGLTPAGGALAAIEAVRSGSVSDSNHQAR